MKLWQYGYKNAISILGASISKSQIDCLLDNKIQRLKIFADGDDAGRRLASGFEKYSHLFKIDFIACKENKDPSDMNQEEIESAFEHKLSLSELLDKRYKEEQRKRLQKVLFKSTANLLPN